MAVLCTGGLDGAGGWLATAAGCEVLVAETAALFVGRAGGVLGASTAVRLLATVLTCEAGAVGRAT